MASSEGIVKNLAKNQLNHSCGQRISIQTQVCANTSTTRFGKSNSRKYSDFIDFNIVKYCFNSHLQKTKKNEKRNWGHPFKLGHAPRCPDWHLVK